MSKPPDSLSDVVAAEVRAEMARHRHSIKDLADTLGVSYKPARERWAGEVAFSLNELAAVAAWLEQPVEVFASKAADRSAA